MTRPEIRPVEFKLGVKSNSTALRGKMYRVSEQKGLIPSSKLKCNATGFESSFLDYFTKQIIMFYKSNCILLLLIF